VYSFATGVPGPESPVAPLVQGSDGSFYGTTAAGGTGYYGTVFKIDPSRNVAVLYNFSGFDGDAPLAPVVQSTQDGNFYGTTAGGGPPSCSSSVFATNNGGCGNAFKMNASGVMTMLHAFSGNDGANPDALIQGSNGNFYGTTEGGGASGGGTVFEMDGEGNVSVLPSFTGSGLTGGPEGALPNGVIQGKDGNLYGTTLIGGNGNLGVVFRISNVGSPTGPPNPQPSITSLSPSSAQAGSGTLTLTIHGTGFTTSSTVTFNGTTHIQTFINTGQLTITLSSSDLATAGNFPVVVTNQPPGGGSSQAVNLTVQAATGNPLPAITGLSPASAPAGSSPLTLQITGTGFIAVSTVTFNGASHTPSFVNSSQLTITLTASDLAAAGSFPVVVTNPAPGGGNSDVMSFMVTGSAGTGASFTILHSFTGADGNGPASLTQGSDGNIYGTATAGGNLSCQITVGSETSQGCGTVFKMDISGNLAVLHSFSGSDGASPSSLIQASDGNFYGTTELGGTSNDGVIFKMDSGGNVTVLHSFSGPDGVEPFVSLVQGTDGRFYGTTISGGTAAACGTRECPGTVFKIDATGNFTSLHTFSFADGNNPFGALVQASDGNFFGTTAFGGAAGEGTIFKISSSGNFALVYSFSEPSAVVPWPLIQASDGSFYGTTVGGGALNYGTVFKMDSAGQVTVLHSFSGSDGQEPTTLLQASDGNFYGTTDFSGDLSCNIPAAASANLYGCGTVFKMDPLGNVTVLHAFAGGSSDGSVPGGLIQGTDGNLYGVASGGGSANDGVVFRISTTAQQ
jgi:uncharacterized repeat protein (TIGR03803 family)